MEQQFRKFDPCATGAIKKKNMNEIIQVLLQDDPELYNEDQIWEQIEKRSKGEHKNRTFHLGCLCFPQLVGIALYDVCISA